MKISPYVYPGVVNIYRHKKPLEIEDIVYIVCAYYKVTRSEVIMYENFGKIALARNLIMYLCCIQGRWNLEEIGVVLLRNHTAIHLAKKRIEERIKLNKYSFINDDIKILTERVNSVL